MLPGVTATTGTGGTGADVAAVGDRARRSRRRQRRSSRGPRRSRPDPNHARSDLPKLYADGCQRNEKSIDVRGCVYGDPNGKTTIAPAR